MQTFIRRVLLTLCIAMLLLTLVSLIPGDKWFIRALDFVREPFFYLAIILGVLAALIVRQRRWLISGGFFAVAAIQLANFWPYFGLAPQQVKLSDAADGDCFTALSLNVKQENDAYDRVAQLIEQERPDLLLLMETNGKWAEELAAEISGFEYVLSKPLENSYGMIFATNMPVLNAEMIANTSANTPTLYATLGTSSGADFEFIGLHPRPPVPGNNTGTRDANIARAGAKTPDRLEDVLVMGDFNDVPWSRTTSQFREAGGWRDPRIGRGTFATFPASYVFAGWPLDQVMVKNHMEVRSFEILENVGADHLPLKVTACVEVTE